MSTTKSQMEHDERVIDNKQGPPLGEFDTNQYADEPTPHLHAKTILVVLAVYSIYFAQLFNIVAAGALARNIAAVVGGGSETTWLVQVIGILTAVLGPPVCQAADYWGRRWFLIILSTFGIIGCIIISRATSMGMVIAGEVVVGVSVGAQPLLHAIPSEVLPRKYRPYAQGGINLSGALGGFVGLVVGGALTRNQNNEAFRTYWYIAAAIYAAAIITVFFLYTPPLRELQTALTFSEKINRLDWIGYVLLALGLVLFSLGLSYGENPYPWTNVRVLAPFLIGAGFLVALGIYEWKFKKDGMFHHGLFRRDRNFPIALCCVFVEGLIFFCSNNYFAFEISTLYETNPLLVGLRYGVAFIMYGTTAVVAGSYCSRTRRVRLPTVVGLTAFVVYNVCMATTTPKTNSPTWGYPIFVGFGLGLCLPSLVTAAQFSTPPELISITSGLMIGMRSIGGVIGLAIYNAVFTAKLSANLGSKIAAAALPLGLPASSLPAFIGDIADSITPTPAMVPGVTPEIIAAGVGGLLEAYSIAFRFVWITAGVLSFVVAVLAAFLFDPKKEFNMHIDAPAEKDEDLYGPGIVGDHNA